MENTEKRNFEKEFEEYISKYDVNDPDIRLKINHMYRVKDLAKEIAIRLYLLKEDIILAEFLGLYHDIGRFEQLKQYHTYDDEKSFDHGDFGANILEKDGNIEKLIPGFSSDMYKVVIAAVRYHNRFVINGDLPYSNHYFCKLIRDADKIDIYRAISEESVRASFFNLDEKEAIITSEVKEAFYDSKTIPKSILKTRADRLVMFLAFVFDLNYSISKEILLRTGNLELFVSSFISAKNVKNTDTSVEIMKMYDCAMQFLRNL